MLFDRKIKVLIMMLLIKRSKCWWWCCWSRDQSVADDVAQSIVDDDDCWLKILKCWWWCCRSSGQSVAVVEVWRWRLYVENDEKPPMIYRCVTLMMLMMISLSPTVVVDVVIEYPSR